jgi:hypothetical protein
VSDTLAGKIAKASADLGNRLKADKKNTQGGGYMYISADKLIAEAGAVLAANGVAVFPAIIGYNVDGGESSGGKRNYIVTVNFAMTVSDGETNMECPWMGAGVDYGAMDKALYKGITSGHKYFLAKLLNIGEGNEDGEHEAPPSEAPSRQEVQPAQTRPTAAAVPNGTATGKSNGSSPAKATGTAKVPDKSNAFKAFMVRGSELFGDEWEPARHWLIERYTTKETPDKVRRSSNELTDVELNALRTNMDKYATGIVKAWREYHDVPAMADVPEMQPA